MKSSKIRLGFRKARIRSKIEGTTERPRLNIKCGHKHIYAQVIDDSKGFTLAEVLVTLGIVAVISVMTIPTLMNNYQKTAYASQLHKVYNMFMNGFALEMQATASTNLREALRGSGLSKPQIAGNFLKNQFNIADNCGTDAYKCFAPQYTSLDGSGTFTSQTSIASGSFYGVILASGSSIAMHLVSSVASTDSAIGYLYVDVNALKGPNVIGKDFFRFSIWPDGVIDDYDVSPNCRTNNSCNGFASAKPVRQNNFVKLSYLFSKENNSFFKKYNCVLESVEFIGFCGTIFGIGRIG